MELIIFIVQNLAIFCKLKRNRAVIKTLSWKYSLIIHELDTAWNLEISDSVWSCFEPIWAWFLTVLIFLQFSFSFFASFLQFSCSFLSDFLQVFKRFLAVLSLFKSVFVGFTSESDKNRVSQIKNFHQCLNFSIFTTFDFWHKYFGTKRTTQFIEIFGTKNILSLIGNKSLCYVYKSSENLPRFGFRVQKTEESRDIPHDTET